MTQDLIPHDAKVIEPKRSAGRRSSKIIMLSAAAFVGVTIWSAFADLDQISRASGQIIPSGKVQVVQAPDGGQITKILVREGDRIRRGQVLFELDAVRAKAAVDEGRGRVASLQAQMARIEAELFDRPLVFPASLDGFDDLKMNQRQLLEKRKAALNGQLNSLGRMRSLAVQELDMNRPLLQTGDVSRSEVMRIERQVVDIASQIENTRNRYLQDLQADYAKVGDELETAQEVLKQREAALQDTVITAPTDGLVKNVRFTTIGGVLRPGDEMLQIVPTGDSLIVEAKVSPADVAYVRQGQTAALKFDAFDSSIYGSAEGVVVYISPDTLTEQLPGVPERSYYRVHINVDTTRMKAHAGSKVQLQPGMTATAEIKTGLGYLLKPITKTLSGSLTER